jgi:A/G-specific adenine glycosylase
MLWSLAQQLVNEAAPDSCSQLNQSLMELGALVCARRNPRCGECPVSSHCVALRQGAVDKLPETAKRHAVTHRRFVAFVVKRGNLYLACQRPAGVLNAHLWEFPNTEILPGDGDLAKAAKAALGTEALKLKRLCTIRHSITRYAITLDAFSVTSNRAKLAGRGQWLTRRQLANAAFCSAHKKILERVGSR